MFNVVNIILTDLYFYSQKVYNLWEKKEILIFPSDYTHK